MALRRRDNRDGAAALAAVAAGVLSLCPPPAAAEPGRPLPTFQSWTGMAGFFGGAFAAGAASDPEGVTLKPGTTTGSWTSRPVRTPDGFGELVPSWQTTTPPGTWVETLVSIQAGGRWSGWFSLGRWAFDPESAERGSVARQRNSYGSVATDVYRSNPQKPPTAYRIRTVLHGTGTRAPLVRQLAVATSVPGTPPPTSATTLRRGIDLTVPQYSQAVHRDEYPRYDGGGAAWCSPTSTAMVMEFLKKKPTAAQLRSLPPDPVFDAGGRIDPVVPWTAAHTYDPTFGGTGNWSFNTAYAAEYGLDASVRRLSSLAEAEAWLKRGVPLVASVRWDNTAEDPGHHLDGAAIPDSTGHLLVIRGFTADGDPIVNDPAFADNASVRQVYRRDQFERAWFRGSDATVYVMRG